jgi:tetratricopeptide (TPR) repeat protein
MLLAKYWTRETVAALALVLGALSFQRVQVWGSEERLWADAAAKAPEKVRPKLWLLRVREDPGDLPNELRRLAPDDPAVSNELGRVYLERGRYREALEEFGRAAAQAPGSPIGYSNRGVALETTGLREAAVESFRQALEVDPCFLEARRNLERLGETAGAVPTGCGP